MSKFTIVAMLAISLTACSKKKDAGQKDQKDEKEVSLEGAISDDDKSAKPTKKQCEAYSNEGDQVPDFAKKQRVADCESKFSVATLKCIREGAAANKVLNNLVDPYGCVTAHPRK